MIQVYLPSNDNFDFNGDMVLTPSSCVIDAELNSAWELTMEHPLDNEGRYTFIQEGGVLKVPSFLEDDQLFRIYEKTRSDTGVTAYARPIFMDAGDEVFLLNNRPENKTGQQALDWMLPTGGKFSGESDITAANTAYYVRKNFLEALSGDIDQSFLNRWGGEVIYDNFKVVVNQRAGGDYGVDVRYGKNMASIEESISFDNVITRIIPEAFNGYTLADDPDTYDVPWIDSEYIDNYPKVYNRLVYFDDIKLKDDVTDEEERAKAYDTKAEVLEALVEASEAMYSDDHVDEPEISMTVSMVQLANTEEYKDLQILEDVGLGDTVHVIHDVFGISAEARVRQLTYDCISEKNESVTLGTTKTNVFDELTAAKEKINAVIDDKTGNVLAEKVSGILDGINTQIRVQNSVAVHQDAMAILFEDTDPNSATFGAMGIGTQGFMISRQRSTDGKSWVWSTVGTAAGLVATAIVAGILSDSNGRFYLDLDTGELKLSDDFIINIGGSTGQGVSFSDYQDGVSKQINDAVSELTGRITEEESARVLLNEKLNSLDLSFSTRFSGGSNLIRNSSGLNGVSDDWIVGDGTVQVTAVQDDDARAFTDAGSYFKINEGSLSYEAPVTQGKQYTLTFKAKKGDNYNGTVSLTGGSPDYSVTISDTNWQEVSGWTFTANNDIVTITAETTGTDFRIADIMLAEGDQSHYWSPAPNEIYTDDVKVDHRGISIINNDSKTESKIDHTQFAILDTSSDVPVIVLTVNRDLTRLKRTQVEDEMTIGKVRFIPKTEGIDIAVLD